MLSGDSQVSVRARKSRERWEAKAEMKSALECIGIALCFYLTRRKGDDKYRMEGRIVNIATKLWQRK